MVLQRCCSGCYRYCSARLLQPSTHTPPCIAPRHTCSTSVFNITPALRAACAKPGVCCPAIKNMTVSSTSALNSSPLLLAFDFDHTIVDGNTDTWITRAAPGGDIPQSLKDSYVPGQWTAYMGRVLEHLHLAGVSSSALQQVLQQLPYTTGMRQLMQHLQQRAAHCIILSDSNSLFINWILSDRGHSSMFSKVYTNPAVVKEQGQLLLEPYHSHTCQTCSVNMCKRTILQDHKRAVQAPYSSARVAYVGDGSNDLCPAQSLGPHDLVFVRAGYALDKLLSDAAVASTVQAEVVRWHTAHDILGRLQQL